MHEAKKTIITLFGVVGSVVANAMGWNAFTQVLLVLIASDYILGVMKGFHNKELSSKVGFKGITKKLVIIFMIIISQQLDQAFNIDYIQMTACMFYIGNEIISIIENVVALDVKVPSVIKKFADYLVQSSEDKEVQ